jgi:CubicO group peptidase (beta-lactamase class C family)
MTGLRDGTPEEAGFSASRLVRASELAASFVEHGDHPAVVVLVARHGVVALHEAFGMLGPEPDAPTLPRDALFPLASLAKTITATATMTLVDEGRIGLTRRVCDYLPEFSGDGREQVYVHHLLTHTSGIESDQSWAEMLEARASELPRIPGRSRGAEVTLQLAYEAPLRASPGTEMFYDNANYDLLGEIVARASNRPLGAFAPEEIFEPLDMADSHARVPDALTGRVVRATPESPNALAWAYPVQRFVTGAGFGYYSTARDMATFGQMFLDRGLGVRSRVLSPTAVTMMTTNQIPGVPGVIFEERHDEASWGFGWGVASAERWGYFPTHLPGTFSHGGASGVYVWCDPAQEVVGAFFSATTKELAPDIDLCQADLFVNAVNAAIDE